MGITLHAIDVWSRTVKSGDVGPDSTLLTLGKQAVYFGYGDLERLLKRNGFRMTPIPPGERVEVAAESLSDMHRGKTFIDDITLFRALGFRRQNISCLDINGFEGADVLFDLNQDWDGRQYDFIFDQGTGEHVFSQLKYFSNLVRMCKLGGVVHLNLPSNDINHGFYNYNRDVMRDFFSANGFEEVFLRYVYNGNYPGAFWHYSVEISADADLVRQSPLYALGLSAVYRKTSDRPITTPNQGLYVQMWQRADAGQVTWTPPKPTLARAILRIVASRFPVIGASLMAAINTHRILKNGNRIDCA